MSIFKEHKTQSDRSASDRSRHKKKIEHAIREGIYDIVSDESIIGQDGKKKIRIPVRGIKEYRFVYGDNPKNKKIGSAPGKEVRRGQPIGQGNRQRREAEQGAGNEAGEEYYEIEITLEELSAYLFDSLDLPDLVKKNFKNIWGEKYKRSGYRKAGIRPRLSKKHTLKNKIKRKMRASVETDNDPTGEEERFPFHKDDLEYKHIKNKPKEVSSAVIFFMMDVSGSMTQQKKYIARSFFFLLYHFLRHKYHNTEIVFISHTTDAKEVSEDEFFTRGNAGGTFISSALELCLDIISTRYHPASWNIYAFHCSDGDNWTEDVEKSIDLSRDLKKICQMYCYTEIAPEEDSGWPTLESGMSSSYSDLKDAVFKIVKISHPNDIWPEFKRIFGGQIDS